ncbi:glutathione S-transferase theta-1-like [Dysidea avara]|uniref:glutathione S-transferase theta-1-like n=1 Tax=Dysidea avara TaxID=196820 RepID=UPI00332C6603
MAGKLKLYTDAFSPVCRAVMWLLESEGIPYEERTLLLRKGEPTSDPEFDKVNPNRRIPAIDDGGFCLFESSAILKYICNKYKLPDHWYPADVQKRALVNQYLSWHTGNLRCKVFFLKCAQPVMTGKINERRIEEQLPVLKKSLDIIDSHFLKDSKFIVGDKISIADLLCLSEITQYWIADFNPEDRGTNVKRWVEDCSKVLNPHFDKINQVVYDCRKDGTFKTSFNL